MIRHLSGILSMVGLAGIATVGSAQEPAHEALDTAYVPGDYRVFTGSGEPASLDDVVAAMGANDVVFIGETHDDPTGHMVEARLLEDAWKRFGATSPTDSASGPPRAAEGQPGRTVALSLEFFEHDVQPVVDEYLAGLITETAFEEASRPWPRYASDYRPLIELAREHGIDVVAANAPRRYVTRVSLHGRESLADLPAYARANLPPLPYGEASEAYKQQWIQTISDVMAQEGTKCGVPVEHPSAPMGSHHQMGNQLDSQVLWDATMGWWISRYLDAHPHALVLHMVGGFHVERGTGIPEQLEAYRPGVRAMVVSLRPVENVDAFEPAPGGQWGDFVIQTDEAHTLEAIECRAFRATHGSR